MLAVPNFSVGGDEDKVHAINSVLRAEARVLDVHSDPVHDRSVFNLSGGAEELIAALAAGAQVAGEIIEMGQYAGAHPAIGALDVAPVVWLDDSEREPAAAAARSAAVAIAAEGIPVFLYGDLATSEDRRERAFFRHGGLGELGERMASGKLVPDLGPARPHARAGATLVTARPPLAAFNLVIDGLDAAAAEAIASRVREAGGGPAGLRAIAIDLGDGHRQISTNVHDPLRLRLAAVVELVRALVDDAGGELSSAEVVGLVPEAALDGFPGDLPIEGFDPARQVIERRLGGSTL